MKLKRSRKKEKTKKEEKHVFIDILLIEVEKFPHCFRRRRNLLLYTCTISFPCFVLFYFTLKFFCFLAAMDWMCARIRESPPSFIYLFIFLNKKIKNQVTETRPTNEHYHHFCFDANWKQ
ncbi:hypothetical protein, unlikely [Trypanosoma brucei gambiense DAL972]|uniref:Uncharacterized protein n=1 Tax=Trypanosoma brucei gambiense (strain MHOM/CI/86/DAL972) TaxID=679716 RepID=C9ZSY5_TRYB9|nr:hypothetical protein, unlikely [Trypanosoma brucei gambiense DAL972]CBH12520.1 hypothetical protein, unlikely [Trypanosoma brucei gambiense DAL972]|eukprot:XP_011774800.1 hypothetical protein, unlikely [Trypanosoma brucei gambiense DAL972]